MKTHQRFSVHITRGNLKTVLSLSKRCFHCENVLGVFRPNYTGEIKTAKISVQFGFVFEENPVKEIPSLSCGHRFRKTPFLKCFPSTQRRKTSVFKFLRFVEAFFFRKAPFS